jgi:hypothetical protein
MPISLVMGWVWRFGRYDTDIGVEADGLWVRWDRDGNVGRGKRMRMSVRRKKGLACCCSEDLVSGST